jgi:NAD-reducing hydrogenase large subunit
MVATTKKVVIEPVTRVEGHGKVTILLDDRPGEAGPAAHRGVPRLRALHPGPALLGGAGARPAALRHLPGQPPPGAAKAMDRIVGGENLTPTAEKMRRLMHYGQTFQSHALHFFHLCSPDLLFGFDADVGDPQRHRRRGQVPDLAVQGVLMRKYGQEIIKATAGKKIHGTGAIPGGINKNLSIESATSC